MHKADPALRRRVLQRLLPPAASGLLTAAALSAMVNRAAWQPSPAVLYLMLGLLLAVGVAMLWPIRRLWALGDDAVAHGRFPPPGYAVLHDTRGFQGEAARLRGRILRAFAVTLAGFVIATPLAVAWLVFALPGAR